MKIIRPVRIVWALGLAGLLGSVIGARVLLGSPAPGDSKSRDSQPADTGPAVICLGHVDIEPGVTPLYPTQVGQVVEVLAEESKTYHKGEVLLRVDSRAARAVLEEAEADLAAAREKLAQAKRLPRRQWEDKVKEQKLAVQAAEAEAAVAERERDYKRFQLKKNNIHPKMFEVAEATVKALKKKVEAEKAKLDEIERLDVDAPARLAANLVRAKEVKVKQARLAVELCELKAPADGEVLRVLVAPGETLGNQPRQPAIWFCPAGKPRIIRAEVPQEFAARVALGKKAIIEDDTRVGPRWTGKVVRMSDWYTHRRSILQEPLQFNDVRTMECIVVVDPSDRPLRIGQRVRVTIGGNP